MNFHKIRLIGILAIAGALYGCSKSAEPEPKTTNIAISIIGKWNYAKDSINFYKSGVIVNKQVVKYTGGEYMTFNADGTGTDGTRSFTYNVTGNTLTLNIKANNGNNASKEVAQVQLLTGNNLNLYYDFIATGNNSIYAYLAK